MDRHSELLPPLSLSINHYNVDGVMHDLSKHSLGPTFGNLDLVRLSRPYRVESRNIRITIATKKLSVLGTCNFQLARCTENRRRNQVRQATLRLSI